ncbi:urease accessory protein UreD [Cohnella fermenti]|uniref:urease accessory protein UreD n=1 Tax=Cohnella fermenti TaxID=2565925 RepID=UPI001454B980|nr:urease accessory protein UreD [Cohnella fermenti]
MAERYHSAPLKIAKSFMMREEAGTRLGIIQMDVSPGLLDGDEYEFDWTAEEGSSVYVTNQAYTRVHPAREKGATVRQRLRLERDAVLEWMPEPVMPFRGARYCVCTDIELMPGSVCVIADLLCPGRVVRGEAFDFDLYDSKLSVRYNQELVHYQRQRFEPARLRIESPGCFGSYTHLATLSVFSDRVDASAVTRIEELLEPEKTKAGLIDEKIVWHVALTARYGIVVTIAGMKTWQLQRLVIKAWDAVRLVFLGSPPTRLLRESWMRDDC